MTRSLFNVGRSFGDEPSRMAPEMHGGTAHRDGPAAGWSAVLAQGEVPEPDLASFQSLLEDEEDHPGLLTALRGDRAAIDELLGKVIAGELPPDAIPGVISAEVRLGDLGEVLAGGDWSLRFDSRLWYQPG